MHFTLPLPQLEASNDEFAICVKAAHVAKARGGGGLRMGVGRRNEMVGWGLLTKAYQWAFHPHLIRIMEHQRAVLKSNKQGEVP